MSGALAAPIPSFDEVGVLPVTIETVVPESFQDENGHMNVRHYFDLHTAAHNEQFDRLGLTQAYRAGGQGFFTAEHHLRYLAEVHVGDQLTVHTRTVERSAKVVYALSIILNQTTRKLASILELTLINVDLTSRGTTPMPASLAAGIDDELAAESKLGWVPPVSGSMGIRRRPGGALP